MLLPGKQTKQESWGLGMAKARKISRVRQIIVSSTGELTPELSLSHRPASSSVTGREDNKVMVLFLALEVCFPATACTACFGYAWTNTA